MVNFTVLYILIYVVVNMKFHGFAMDGIGYTEVTLSKS